MPKRCVVGKCGAVNKDGLSLHKFPKDERIRKSWVEFVESTRPDFNHLSPYSYVSSLHFKPDCYEKNELAKSLGFGTRLVFEFSKYFPKYFKSLYFSKYFKNSIQFEIHDCLPKA